MGAATSHSAPIGIAQMRDVYRCADVEKRLAKLPERDHEPLQIDRRELEPQRCAVPILARCGKVVGPRRR